MPVVYHFEGRCIRMKNVGETSIDEIVEAFEAALNDPALPERSVLLWDVRESSSLKDRSAVELKQLTGVLGPKAHLHSNTSGLIVSKGLYHGLMRMVAAYGEPFESNMKIFQDEASALAWVASLDDEAAD